jgi:hypothetical protein
MVEVSLRAFSAAVWCNVALSRIQIWVHGFVPVNYLESSQAFVVGKQHC